MESPLACAGRLTDLSSIISAPFRAATIFVGLAVIVALLCIICFLMFCFLRSSTVFHLCAWMQLLSGEPGGGVTSDGWGRERGCGRARQRDGRHVGMR